MKRNNEASKVAHLKRYGLDEEGDSADERKTPGVNIHKILFDHRTLTLFGEIDSACAQETSEDLLALAYENDDPITMFLGSPGGHVESGDTVFDVIPEYLENERT